MSDPTSEHPGTPAADQSAPTGETVVTVDAVDAVVPAVKVRPRRRLPSFVWAVPVIAALIGVWLVVQGITSQGAGHHYQL